RPSPDHEEVVFVFRQGKLLATAARTAGGVSRGPTPLELTRAMRCGGLAVEPLYAPHRQAGRSTAIRAPSKPQRQESHRTGGQDARKWARLDRLCPKLSQVDRDRSPPLSSCLSLFQKSALSDGHIGEG